MAQVLVRELEDDIVERLKRRAQRNGRSLEAELRIILANAIKPTVEEALEEMRRVREEFKGRHFSDSAELIRDDRDSR